MRVVLDANVLARSAYNQAGPAAAVLNEIRGSQHVLIVSAFILSEIDRALRYPRFRRYHGLSDAEIDRFVFDVEAASLVLEMTEQAIERVVPFDPDDDYVVATAVAGNADVICTRNMKHFHHPDVIAYCRQRAIRQKAVRTLTFDSGVSLAAGRGRSPRRRRRRQVV